ncbi:MAG: copper chaperone PCu(A)C [Candidatus Rokubacteria bacterium]|nr:copper chaperone PCu(A)C [Candidatus Rokubacteria bacterium]
MRMRTAVTILAALGAVLVDAPGLPAQEPRVRLENAWARRAPMMAGDGQAGGKTERGNGAVYVTVVNRGKAADSVVAAATDAADKVELHETYNMSGMMMMRPLPKFDVPAGGKLEMKPGSYHLMLFGLRRDLEPGDTVKVTLTLEKAGALSVDARVR